jgi:K+-sensing histidine kinase KdpD
LCPTSLRALVPDGATRWVVLRPRALFEHPRLGRLLARAFDDAGDQALFDRARRVGYDLRTVDRAAIAWSARTTWSAGVGAFDTRRIEAMLAFSKISGRELVFGPADLSAIVRETLSGLELMVEQTRAVVQIAPLPVVHSDAVLLGIIFQNLLSNALKYRRRDLDPVVVVRSAPLEGGKWRIDVTDNGLGFDAADSQRIFAPFERLHSSLEGQEAELHLKG